MKKLLSICFLSILLGLLSFSTQAQSSCYGFWMENLQPDVLTGVANCGNPNGTYALNHTLGHAVLIGESNEYRANVVASDNVELYELHFCDCGEGKQVSLDWLLYKRNFETGEWELVNENLSDYADFSIYTLYPQINSTTGQCQSIKWLGGQVPNGFGVCEYDPTAVPSLYDSIMGIPACNTPTNYPGAMQSQAGTLPGSVVNVLGETTASIGMTPIYSQGFDYFYADFLASTRTIVAIKWRQAGDYKLVMNVRERIGGTPWTNCTWNKYGENNVLNETAYIGGHMACCGPVILSDTLHYPVLDTLTMEVCEGTTDTMGSPFTFVFGDPARSIVDTTILIGELYNQNTNCQYIDIDTLRNVNYLVRMNPIAQIAKHKDTLCKCDELTTAMVRAMVEFDSTEIATFVTGDETVEYSLQWFHWVQEGDSLPAGTTQGYGWFESIYPRSYTVNDNNDTTYMYIVRQVNTYNNYGDTVVCEGPADTLYITFREITAPVLSDDVEICYNDRLNADSTHATITVIAQHDTVCANTTKWYTAVKDNTQYPNAYVVIDSTLVFTGDEFEIDLAAYAPKTNRDTVVKFYAVSYDTENGCMSTQVAVFTLTYNQNPELAATITPEALVCPGSEAAMQVTITNDDVDPDFTYFWDGTDTVEDNFTQKVVTVGNGTETFSYLPTYELYNYSYTQQIYPKEEVPSGTITKIEFKASEVNVPDRKIAIYLSVVDRANFNDGQWDNDNNKKLVFQDSVHFVTGWNAFEITPFEYDAAQGNLMVTCIDLTGDWVTYNPFYVTYTGDYTSKYTFRDEAPYTLNAVVDEYHTNIYNLRNNARFTVEPMRVPQPVEINEVAILDDTASSLNTVPVNNQYNYSYSEQIYLASELGGVAADITALSFDYNHTAKMTKKTNVDIYLAQTTVMSSYSSNTAHYADFEDLFSNVKLVYSGDLNCEKGWNQITLDSAFAYDGHSNLVVIVHDKSGAKDGINFKFNVNSAANKAVYRATNSSARINPKDMTGSGNVAQRISYRPNIKFHFHADNPGFVTDNKSVNAYKQVTTFCDSAYTSAVYVVDANNCPSNVVTFNYTTGDTLKPVLTKYDTTMYVNTCEADTIQNLFPAYETIDAFNNSGLAEVSDNCKLVAISHNDVITPATATTCEMRVVRTYTFVDSCGNDTTFVQTIIGHDSVAPLFALERPIRLDPVPAGDCKFNAPSQQVLIDAIAPYVVDNCTDSAFLMDGIVFVWENTDLNPAGDTNIFRIKTHLTINATITDKCGNTHTEGVFFLDRPDTLKIAEPAITPLRDALCQNADDTLFFDMNKIVDDTVMGPFSPYTLQWSVNEPNANKVTFTNPTNDTTGVTFTEGGMYEFMMTVTDKNGCVAASAYSRPVYVRELPHMVINPVPADVETPLCPTYGYLTIEASLVNPVDGQNLRNSYFYWSGESVNIASHDSLSFIHIIPTYCDTLYTATAVTTDDMGCPATATYSVRAKAKTPHFIDSLGLADYVLDPKAPDCALIVPNFKDSITGAMIDDDCYGFYEANGIGIKYTRTVDTLLENLKVNGFDYDWYVQSPAAGDTIYGNTVVNITITNPCGAQMFTTVNLLKPSDYITVVAGPDTALCQDVLAEGNGVSFLAVASKTASYVWNNAGMNDTLSETNVLTLVDTLMNGGNDFMIYNYVVTATDTLGCIAKDTATLTVYYQGDDIDFRTWPNTMCERYNGIIAIDTVPTGFAVVLDGIDDLNGDYYKLKYSDVPAHEATQWNTIYFDSLVPGWYHATVINLHGCERGVDILVDADPNGVDSAIFTVTLAYCNGQNGAINVTEETGYSYELRKNVSGVWVLQNNHEGVVTAGDYWLKKIQNSTHCDIDTFFAVNKEESDLTFSVTVTDNTKCYSSATSTSLSYNGVIKFNTVPLTYSVKRQNADGSWPTSWNIMSSYTITSSNSYHTTGRTGLQPGFYAIKAVDSEGCDKYDTVEIKNTPVMPVFTVSTTPNNACTNDLRNGTISVDPAADYTYFVDDTQRNASWFNTTKFAASTHTVRAVAPNTYCRKDTTVIIKDSLFYPVVTVDSIIKNASCNPEVMAYNGGVILDVTADTNKTNIESNFNTYIQPYKVELKQGSIVKASKPNNSVHSTTVTGVIEGSYTWLVTSKFGCTASQPVVIGHDSIPAMQLAQIPDHYCHPISTTKPGDGQVIIQSPLAVEGEHFYEYRFFDSSKVEMQVPYDLPMTHTMYWMASGLYHVTAYDTVTGCMVEDSIEVLKADFQYVINVAKTPSHYCSETSGDGTVTLTVTTNNPDAVFVYKHEANGEWQTSNVFTNLAMGDHNFFVKDITTACENYTSVKVTADTCKPTFFIHDNEGRTDNFTYCIYNDDVTLYGRADTECDDNFKFSWYAPCSDINHSNDSTILVDIDHVIANGCAYIFTAEDTITGCIYDTTVIVTIHERPNFYFTINQDTYPVNNGSAYPFCEQEILNIGAVAAPWDDNYPTDVPTLVAYDWTLGHVGTEQNFTITGEQAFPTLDYPTFCVRVQDNNGCWSNIGSLGLKFNRVNQTVVYDTACDAIEIDNVTYTYDQKGSNFDVVVNIPNPDMSVNHQCGTEVTHHVTLYKSPVPNWNVLTQFTDSTYCYPYGNVIAEMIDSVKKYSRPTDSVNVVVMIQPTNGGFTDFGTGPLTYNNYNSHFKMVVTNSYRPECNPVEREFDLNIQKDPVIDSFNLAELYCNNHDTTLTVLVTNNSGSALDVKLALPTGVITGTPTTVPARQTRYPVTFTFTPTYATYNAQPCTLRVGTLNAACSYVEETETFNVTTDGTINIASPTICEGETVSISSFSIPTGYQFESAWKVNGTQLISIDLTQPITSTTTVKLKVTNACGDDLYTEPATITVIPGLRIKVNDTHYSVCKADAQAYLDTLVVVQNASYAVDTTWSFVGYTRAAGSISNTSTRLNDTVLVAFEDLADSIYKYFKADILVTIHHSNNCNVIDSLITTLRIVDTPAINSIDTATICMNTTLADMSADEDFTFDWNNLINTEFNSVYKLVHNGVATTLNYNTPLSNVAVDNDSLMIVAVGPCANDTAIIILNILNADSLIQDTLQAACKGKAFSEFIVALPQFVGDEEIINDTVWFRGATLNELLFSPDTITVDSIINETAWVRCQITTTCLDTLYTTAKKLMVDTLPIVEIAQDTLHVCEGSTIDAIDFTVSDVSIVTDTVWFLHTKADTLKSDYHFKRADNEAKIYVEIKTTCGSVFDSTVVVVDTLPIPNASGDVVICRTGDATMQVTNAAQTLLYAWIFDNDTVATGTSLTAHFAPNAQYTDSTDVTIDNETYTVLDNTFYEFTVVATDPITGCTSNTMVNTSNDPYASDVVTVKSTDAPQFVFKYQGNETHTINGLNVDGSLTDYTWEVSAPCTDKDRLVFVEYTIYHNGEVINNDSLSNYLLTQTTSSGVTTNMWVTRNIIGWENTQHDSLFTRQYFRSAVPGFETPQGTQTGNHFPNNDMAFGNNQQFDDLYMHFLNNNPVKKTIAPFVQGGEYKIVYRLIATSNEVPYQHLYFNTEDSVNKKIGGHIAYGGTLTELAIDSIILNVAGDTTLVVNQTPAAPELAPSISTEENVIVPEMEVWPNPAPSIVTTFKARVHNMSGDATVTITNFTGKQVYSGNMFIDSDNFYFEADVNSLAVGAYIMTVRTKDAVVTKKLVVTVRQ